MADKSAAGAWSKDWDALNRQYWNAWSEAARQGGGDAVGKMPWHEGLEQWSRLFAPKAQPQNEVVDRMLSGARQFFGFAQAAAQQAAEGGTAKGNAWSEAFTRNLGAFSAGSNPMLEAMRSLAGEGAMGWEQLAAETHRLAGPMKQEVNAMLSLPTVGFTREHQERFQQLAAANVEYQEWSARYNALMFKASQRAIELMESKLGMHSEPGRELTSLRALYDVWVDAAEEGYAEVALSPEFREVYGNMVNAQMGVRKLVNAEVERGTQQVGMPTRTEINTVHERLHDMRRRLAELEDQLAARAPRARTETGEASAGKPAATRRSPRPAARAAARPEKAAAGKARGGAFAAQLAASRKPARKGRR